ncbi:unnamed protein product, partial [Rotaria sordida]
SLIVLNKYIYLIKILAIELDGESNQDEK